MGRVRKCAFRCSSNHTRDRGGSHDCRRSVGLSDEPASQDVLLITDPVSISYSIIKSYASSFISDYQQLPGHDPCNPIHNSLFNSLKALEEQKNDRAEITAQSLTAEAFFAAIDIASLFTTIAEIRGAAAAIPTGIRVISEAEDFRGAVETILEAFHARGSSWNQSQEEATPLQIGQAVSGAKSILNQIMDEVIPNIPSQYIGAYSLIDQVLTLDSILSHITVEETRHSFQLLRALKQQYDNAVNAYELAIAESNCPECSGEILNLAPVVSGPASVWASVGET